uniref:Secreted protein n=1 Tax=Hydrogenovibrio crunogenus (strain DSM 25203 / XCL-2) TaxID=317025 RepID=Q31FA9_HYDCU
MFKRFFLIIFISQTLASTAWGGVSMSDFTHVEKTRMQIMHQVMDITPETMQVNAGKMSSIDSSIMPAQINMSGMDCSNCDDSQCHNLLCYSIHAAPIYSFNNIPQWQSIPNIQPEYPTLTIAIGDYAIKPETPPPSA